MTKPGQQGRQIIVVSATLVATHSRTSLFGSILSDLKGLRRLITWDADNGDRSGRHRNLVPINCCAIALRVSWSTFGSSLHFSTPQHTVLHASRAFSTLPSF